MQEPPIAATEIQVKNAIRKNSFACSIFGSMYSFSPYMGCSHACLYCDGRAEKYHVEGDFVHDVRVRTNIAEQLQSTLPKLREIGPIHLSSGISDVYQAAEKKYRLTGLCSEILADHDFPVSVLTKSALILRDFDHWAKVQNRGGFTLQMTMTTLDDSIRKTMEPGASSVEERLEAIQAFKGMGCPVGIYMMPLLPGITDTDGNIERLLQKLLDLKVDYIMPGTLTLRPGRQKDLYIRAIERKYPQLKQAYSDIYHEERASGMPNATFYRDFNRRILKHFEGITTILPHGCYRGTMPLYCELLILLEHMIQLYSYRKVNVKGLSAAYDRLRTYLSEEKKSFNRKRSLPFNHIDKHLVFLLQTDAFNPIIDNPKLTSFIEKVILENKVFDYQSLSLT